MLHKDSDEARRQRARQGHGEGILQCVFVGNAEQCVIKSYLTAYQCCTKISFFSSAFWNEHLTCLY